MNKKVMVKSRFGKTGASVSAKAAVKEFVDFESLTNVEGVESVEAAIVPVKFGRISIKLLPLPDHGWTKAAFRVNGAEEASGLRKYLRVQAGVAVQAQVTWPLATMPKTVVIDPATGEEKTRMAGLSPDTSYEVFVEVAEGRLEWAVDRPGHINASSAAFVAAFDDGGNAVITDDEARVKKLLDVIKEDKAKVEAVKAAIKAKSDTKAKAKTK